MPRLADMSAKGQVELTAWFATLSLIPLQPGEKVPLGYERAVGELALAGGLHTKAHCTQRAQRNIKAIRRGKTKLKWKVAV